MAYQHRDLEGRPLDLPVGKVVCIGRNYLDHIRELNNVVPETPILFIKPATALRELNEPIRLSVGRGECHHEVELAVLVGRNCAMPTLRPLVRLWRVTALLWT